MLFCEKPAEYGGEWIVGDGRAILRDLDREVVAKFESKHVTYRVFYESVSKNNRYTNWQDNISPTKEGVELYLSGKQYEWSWGNDDSLTYWKTIPAVHSHPIPGEPCFFQQIHPHHKTFYSNHPFFAGKPVSD